LRLSRRLGRRYGPGDRHRRRWNAYIAGETESTETTFPVKTGPDLSQNGDKDAFIARVSYWDIWHPTHAVGDFDGTGRTRRCSISA